MTAPLIQALPRQSRSCPPRCLIAAAKTKKVCKPMLGESELRKLWSEVQAALSESAPSTTTPSPTEVGLSTGSSSPAFLESSLDARTLPAFLQRSLDARTLSISQHSLAFMAASLKTHSRTTSTKSSLQPTPPVFPEPSSSMSGDSNPCGAGVGSPPPLFDAVAEHPGGPQFVDTARLLAKLEAFARQSRRSRPDTSPWWAETLEGTDDEESQLQEDTISELMSVHSVTAMSFRSTSGLPDPRHLNSVQADSPRSAQESFPSARALQRCGRIDQLRRPVGSRSCSRRPSKSAADQLPPLPGAVADWVPQIVIDHLKEAQAGKQSRPMQKEPDLKVMSCNSKDDFATIGEKAAVKKCAGIGTACSAKPGTKPPAQPVGRSRSQSTTPGQLTTGLEQCSGASRSAGRRLKRMLNRLWRPRGNNIQQA